MHSIETRVYYEDTDSGGIVYYANYFKFAERGRTELLRHLGFDHQYLLTNHHKLLVVKTAAADYKIGAKLDDLLRVETTLGNIKKASVDMHQKVYRGASLCVDLCIKIACISEHGKAVAFPEELRHKFVEFSNQTS